MGETIPILSRTIKGYYDSEGNLVMTSDTLIDRREDAKKIIEESIRNRERFRGVHGSKNKDHTSNP